MYVLGIDIGKQELHARLLQTKTPNDPQTVNRPRVYSHLAV
ncbi:hypothetical protein Deipe_4136 (plasmid) [Deinococcus peraridilitoris DSM 19664]|uniref:Transposase n=1 Tax=Deinococcus peraridilitoris (strain DSM 19664 / LMG 22246 / CIP 109416 / KR-200) TaxID=937777 RepID=L0A6J1_DEIPD|nr:hypothetical protein Deipe_4136 [Deinococcus peraridilitoris DSM 19664]